MNSDFLLFTLFILAVIATIFYLIILACNIYCFLKFKGKQKKEFMIIIILQFCVLIGTICGFLY